MPVDLNSLTVEEGYVVWCERIRMLFQTPFSPCDRYRTDPYERVYSGKHTSSEEGPSSEAFLHSSPPSNTPDDVENVDLSTKKEGFSGAEDSASTTYYDQKLYPFCFYMKMLQTAREVDSSRQPHKAHPELDAFNAADAAADRLAIKLRNEAAQMRRQNDAESRRTESGCRKGVQTNARWRPDPTPSRDPTLEAMLSAMHDDMTELLLYANNRNRASHELQSQLAYSKRLLLRYSAPDEDDCLIDKSDG
ncbi:unnamed protein product [Phytomonas sp. Hart1]|nr:unnamed protein product [Phytomonas sp. Hart1]|eukprot:CCW68946.1 unnamed protein product [Phytomonas sp. isolate Hart1]